MVKKRGRKRNKNNSKKRRVGNFALGTVLTFLVKPIYIMGLAVLIPLVYTLSSPQQIVTFTKTNTVLVLIAVLFISFTVYSQFWHKKNWGRTCKKLAFWTLIPGALALLFALFTRSAVFGILEFVVPGFRELEPLVVLYINETVPRVWKLTLAYVILGVVLYGLGVWLEKRKR